MTRATQTWHALAAVAAAAALASPARAAAPADFQALGADYQAAIRPLLVRYCHECHSGSEAEAEVDLAPLATLADVRKRPQLWQKVGEMLDGGQMPPKDARQPADAERARLQAWVRALLTAEAAARAGDPGRVELRRLNNAEYTYTLRDLTGVDALDPAREFPVDGAAGEGFTNAGGALSMSPALVAKYLDAAKEVARHIVLLPDGIRFSPSASRRDWTEESLARIRDFYAPYVESGGATAVNLQGIQFDTNQGGRLAVEKYLAATLAARDDLLAGRTTIVAVARQRGLNAKYLGRLWQTLAADAGAKPSLLVDRLRQRWRAARPADAAALAAEVAAWQQALWKFNSVGQIGRHLGRKDGPASWQEAANPISARRDIRLKLAAQPGAKDVTLYFVAGDAGDGNADDFVVWERPRLVAPGRSDLPLRQVRAAVSALAGYRRRIVESAAACLAAAAEAQSRSDPAALAELAARHGVEAEILGAWLEYLGIGGPAARIDGHLRQKLDQAEGYDFIQGWGAADALSVVANSSDRQVRIPGNMKPHGVAVHPSPTERVVVGWRSPVAATLRVEGAVQHAHPECGNGVTWSLELRRGNTRQRLVEGVAQGAAAVTFGPLEKLAVRQGDVIALAVGPRDGNHSCDLTAVDLTLGDGRRQWSLAADVAPDILAGNPHADRQGNADVWHFYSEPDRGAAFASIPAGSLLARWQSTPDAAERQKLADALQRQLQSGAAEVAKDSPDAALYRQLTSLSGPLLAAARGAILQSAQQPGEAPGEFGLDPARFGRHPLGPAIDVESLCVQAPAVIEVRLPADLVEGCELVTAGTLHREPGGQGSVRLQVLAARPDSPDGSPATPIVALEGSAARARIEAGFDDFRRLFPAALCYTKIVPVDEVVTLTLFHREDEPLRRLMLDEEAAARLDRLWEELFYVSQEPLLLAAAFEQLYEYATQDRPDIVRAFEPMKAPIADRAAAFRQRMVDDEPRQLAAVVEFAGRAFRRPLAEAESNQVRALYADLRKQEIPHDEALRLTLARVLVAPAFLYRLEKPAAGAGQAPVDGHELASRLSYFLWSSPPDEELRREAAAGRLTQTDVLLAQTRRMLHDPKARRLAAEFLGQWLHIYRFDEHDEKSERHFPTFNALRGAMYEESLRFFTDLVQNDGSLLALVDADHTFVNEELARHYGIPGVTGPAWRRVEGSKRYSRGGMLTQASTLSKQAGASRTSPILRGNWLSEVVLGERLPKPPKNVPQLPETAPQGLTERQLIESHSTEPGCAKCHARIDPLGFALENFDAIGRFRRQDSAGLPIDSNTRLSDGTRLEGLAGLQQYLLGPKRESFVRQFNRKLLGYALGRSVQLSDEPLLNEMQARLAAEGFNVRLAIELVVSSRQFREIRGDRAAAE